VVQLQVHGITFEFCWNCPGISLGFQWIPSGTPAGIQQSLQEVMGRVKY